MSSIRQAVLASNNPGKLKEIGEILSVLGINLIPQSRFNVPAVAETGHTYIENAIIKARMASAVTGLPAIADDSGIEVDILNGAPGIFSARYAGENATDQENLDLLLKNVTATGEARPVARYQCVIVYLRYGIDSMPLIAQGTWEGQIAQRPKGNNGFGYDPIFYVPTHKCTSAELSSEVKNAISHRSKALDNLSQILKNKILTNGHN